MLDDSIQTMGLFWPGGCFFFASGCFVDNEGAIVLNNHYFSLALEKERGRGTFSLRGALVFVGSFEGKTRENFWPRAGCGVLVRRSIRSTTRSP